MLYENHQKGVTSLQFCQVRKVELRVGMKPCLIRFYNYFDTILAEACWVKQSLISYSSELRLARKLLLQDCSSALFSDPLTNMKSKSVMFLFIHLNFTDSLWV